MDSNGNGESVRYSVKDLLGRIEAKLDRLAERLDREVGALEPRLSAIEARAPYLEELTGRVSALEKEERDTRQQALLHAQLRSHIGTAGEVANLQTRVDSLEKFRDVSDGRGVERSTLLGFTMGALMFGVAAGRFSLDLLHAFGGRP